MPGIVKTYTDIDLNFTPHPVTGDVTILKNADAVKRSIKNLIYSDFYERPFQNKLGSGLRQLLFENISPMTQKAIEVAVQDVLRGHEKRINVIDVVAKVNADHNGYNVVLTFSIDSLSQILKVDVFLERIR